jgi:thioredoxin-related protein
MNKKLIISVLVILGLGICLNFVILKKQGNAIVNEAIETPQVNIQLASKEKNPDEAIKWYSFSEALELQAINKKKIFVDVYTNWCGPCKFYASNTLSNAVIQKALTEYFIPVKFNAEGNDTIQYKGTLYVNKNPTAGPRRSTHELTYAIAQTPQGIGYPTTVFIDEELNVIQPISGALSAQQLEPILSFFGTDAYKTTTWDVFQKNFVSNLATGNQ